MFVAVMHPFSQISFNLNVVRECISVVVVNVPRFRPSRHGSMKMVMLLSIPLQPDRMTYHDMFRPNHTFAVLVPTVPPCRKRRQRNSSFHQDT